MTEPEVNASTNARGKIQRWINQMIQLQDLIFARDQQEASMPGARLTTLDASIQTLMEDLPIDIRSHFTKMHKKANLAIVPIASGVCSACGMAIPVSQVHAVHAAEKIYQCPSCARFLFYPESAPRRLGQRRFRSEPAQVGMARFSSPQLMVAQLDAADRDAAIAELCDKMESEGFVDNASRLCEEALRREAIASTAVEHGLAFPHVRGVEGGGLTLALGLSKKGIKFSGAKALTRIVFFIVIPTAASAFYLRLLSGLSQTFGEEEARNQLLKADTSEELWKALNKATRTSIP